jgi:molecular chaperone GrpE (heat shock protein)
VNKSKFIFLKIYKLNKYGEMLRRSPPPGSSVAHQPSITVRQAKKPDGEGSQNRPRNEVEGGLTSQVKRSEEESDPEMNDALRARIAALELDTEFYRSKWESVTKEFDTIKKTTDKEILAIKKESAAKLKQQQDDFELRLARLEKAKCYESDNGSAISRTLEKAMERIAELEQREPPGDRRKLRTVKLEESPKKIVDSDCDDFSSRSRSPSPRPSFRREKRRDVMFYIKSDSGLPTFSGKNAGLDDVDSFLLSLERHFQAQSFRLHIREGLTNGWVNFAVLQLRDEALLWANRKFPPHRIDRADWILFCSELRKRFIPVDALLKLEDEWELLKIGRTERVSAFNERFLEIFNKLDRHKRMSKRDLLSTYRAKLLPNIEASKYLSSIRRLSLRELPLEEAMAAVAEQDTLTHSKSSSHSRCSHAKRVEASVGSTPQSSGTRHKGGSNDQCSFCKKPGHKLSDCWEMKRFQKFSEWERERSAVDKDQGYAQEKGKDRTSSMPSVKDGKKRRKSRKTSVKTSIEVDKGGFVESCNSDDENADKQGYGSLSDSGKD